MSRAPASGRFPWHTVIIVVLTAGLIFVFLRSIDVGQAWAATKRAHVGWIIAAVCVTLQTYILRAWRWQLLLRPIGRASFRTAFRTTVIGFAASFLLPARIGEVLRPYLLARTEGLNATSTFATVIVERLIDLCTVLMLFAVALLNPGIDVGPDVKLAGEFAAAGSIVGLTMLSLLAGHPERLGRWAASVTGRLPPKLGHTLQQFVQTFAEGLKVMRSPGHLAGAILWSIPLWLSIALGIMFTSWAFDLAIPFAGSFVVVGYLAVGVAVPTPGATGGFHTAYLLALTQVFHAPASEAGAAAIVLHLVSFVPVTLLGLLFMWQDGLTLGRLKGMRAEAAASEHGTPAGVGQ
ncbi:MAG: lysylphosphatidylglycerol synthase transmembrane domain-containing protein [Vicinamibacterales bacterium]